MLRCNRVAVSATTKSCCEDQKPMIPTALGYRFDYNAGNSFTQSMNGVTGMLMDSAHTGLTRQQIQRF